MAECVISPWWFYAMSVCNDVKYAFGVAAVGGVMVVALFAMIAPIFIDMLYDDDASKYKKDLTGLIKLAAAAALLYAIIPTKETLIQMLIAKNVTYDLVGQATDVVQQVYMDIMALFE